MGFKTAVLNDVRVSAATPATIKVALEVGGLEETVVVQARSEIIQTQSAAVTSTIDANQILKLPTGSRSALEFVTSLPGVNTPAGSRDSTINGLPQSSINITIDGVSAQDNWLKTTDGFFARVSPRLDAIEEVTVSSAAQDASEHRPGRRADPFRDPLGQQQLERKRLFLPPSLHARRRPTGSTTATASRRTKEKLFQPGGRVGGPIVIPGLFNGRDKAFFFVNYEESRSPGQKTENRTILHPTRAAGPLPLDLRRRNPVRSTC